VFDDVLKMAADGFATRRGRRAALIHRDEVNGRVRGRRGTRLLALTSGGAIPEVADYRVVLEPEDLFIGTINEDFAIESMAGDVFQLGNASWRVLQVGQGTVRVADAKGAPPNIPFWLGEAPGRSDELSSSVSDLRADLERALDASEAEAVGWLCRDTGLPRAAAEQLVAYLADARRALGALPTQHTLIVERFFDESGGMQLVLHAPFGSRVNKAWGLALRKRFCRQFNFELQAAATEDAVLLSLGPQHSFPLADVFRYLHPATAKDVLVQALLDAPVFQTRWRWNTTVALAVPRRRGANKMPAQLQRMLADDLMAAVFPDAAACLENIPGDRQIPDHPLVSQTVRDCLQEAMDYEGLAVVLGRVHAGGVRLVSRDTVEPSPLAHEVLNARPYAFLDDAPLEERRAHALYARRATAPATTSDPRALDAAAIARVREEARPAPRDAEELHDALLTAGFLFPHEPACDPQLFEDLRDRRRAVLVRLEKPFWAAAERLPEIFAIHPSVDVTGTGTAPASRSLRPWSATDAIVEIVRGRLTLVGPTTADALAGALNITADEVMSALMALEAEGTVLRGSFTGSAALEWCDRSLLARIHRYTLNRLRAEIEPVSGADYMRFLFAWQHADPSSRLTGVEGLRTVIEQLDGFELPAAAWERTILPARVEGYGASLLDALCLSGDAAWARLSHAPSVEGGGTTRLAATTPIALFPREHRAMWQRARSDGAVRNAEGSLSAVARAVLAALRARGASFTRDLARACSDTEAAIVDALGELASAGLVSSDGFAGVRAMIRPGAKQPSPDRAPQGAGRWSVLDVADSEWEIDALNEAQARVLLRRYGVVFRRVVARETNLVPWRDLARVLRRLEARGEIRGGRFVSGMAGEQFALPAALEQLREIRRTPPTGRLLAICAADPLNLAGILTSGERVRAIEANRIVYRDGIAIAALEGEFMRPLAPIDRAMGADVVAALTGRRLPAVTAGYVGR
jgi:ATP-dependent Lhr-like helicase